MILRCNQQILSKIISEDCFAPQVGDTFIQTFKPGCRIGPDQHDTIEVINVISGSCYMEINNHYVKIRAEECLVLFPSVRHCFFLDKTQNCRLMNVHFRQKDIPPYFDLPALRNEVRFFYELKTNSMSYLKLGDNSALKGIAERIIKEASGKEASSELLLRLYFCEMYIQLSRMIEQNCEIFTRPLSRPLCRALEFIRDFYNEGITLEQVAGHAGISSRHLSRIFGEELDISVHDYMNRLRIQNAKKLLEHTGRSLTEIACSGGFGSSQYFSTCFKKHEGITPKQYRSLVRNSNSSSL
jgi:AraC-like DNA-binding protein